MHNGGVLKMAVGQSDDVDAQSAVAQAIDQCRTQLAGKQPKAGVLFCAIESFDGSLIDRVREAFPGVKLIGASSAAEMSSGSGYLEDSVALALFASDDIETGVAMAGGAPDEIGASVVSALDEARRGITAPVKMCIVLADPAIAQLAAETLNSSLPGALVVGGGSGGDELGMTVRTYQLCNDRVETHGAAILLLAGDLALSSAVGTGWTVLGPSGTVTRAEYGVIEEIDDRPAADFLRGYIEVGRGAAVGNPLAIQDVGSDGWYLRVVLGSDDRGALMIPGGVSVGATVQLTTTNPHEMLVATAEAVDRAREAFPADATPTAALIFSCAVRKYMLGTRSSHEVAAAQAALPTSMPIAGMYCIGEIAPTGSSAASHFLNETFVTVLLGG
jgi:hypothetical protein